jgi:thiosulfate dehydrogenase [quinone] large subunit
MTLRIQGSGRGDEDTGRLPESPAGSWLFGLRLLAGGWFLSEGLTKYLQPGEFGAGWFLETRETIVSPLLNLFAGGASEAVVNLLVPAVEVVVGLALILGLGTRTGAAIGSMMLGALYLGLEQWHRGLVNTQLLGVVLFCTLIVFGAGRVLGLDSYLEATGVVERRPWLRYFLG